MRDLLTLLTAVLAAAVASAQPPAYNPYRVHTYPEFLDLARRGVGPGLVVGDRTANPFAGTYQANYHAASHPEVADGVYVGVADATCRTGVRLDVYRPANAAGVQGFANPIQPPRPMAGFMGGFLSGFGAAGCPGGNCQVPARAGIFR